MVTGSDAVPSSEEWRAHASQSRARAARAERWGDRELASFIRRAADEMERRARLAADAEAHGRCAGLGRATQQATRSVLTRQPVPVHRQPGAADASTHGGPTEDRRAIAAEASIGGGSPMLTSDEVLAEARGRRHRAREAPIGLAIAEHGTPRVGTAAKPRRRTRRRFRTRRLLVSALLLFALLAASSFGWHWWTIQRFIEATEDANVQSDISVVSSKVQGPVREILVKDNQPVKAGDVVVTSLRPDNHAQESPPRRDVPSRVSETAQSAHARR
jgi:hypothetical protein